MKKVQIGARISQEDAEFISQLKIEGAHTPSDKLRAIIESARRKSEYSYDFAGSYRMIKEELNPIVEYVKETEHGQGSHSDVVARILEWMPDFYAYCLSALKPGTDDAVLLSDFEKEATDRLFRLVESLVHLELSRKTTSYNPQVVRNHLESLEQLIQIINSTPKKKED